MKEIKFRAVLKNEDTEEIHVTAGFDMESSELGKLLSASDVDDFIVDYCVDNDLDGDWFIEDIQQFIKKVGDVELYEGDVFSLPDHRFYDGDNLNFVAVASWDPEGVYFYQMIPVSDSVKGSATGQNMDLLGNYFNVTILGNRYGYNGKADLLAAGVRQ